MADGNCEDEEKIRHCCLSHEFYRAATRNPNKIAVIHASLPIGGPRISRDSIDGSQSVSSSSPCHRPPVYEGDHCFTYSDVLSSVEALSARLHSILDGADDPHLIKPQLPGSSLNSQQALPLHALKSSMPLTPFVQQSTELRNMYTPKIIGIYVEPSVEYIIAVLSALRCGEAFLPLDPSWPKDRILSIVSSNVDLIICCGLSSGKRGSCSLDKLHWIVECSRCPILGFSMKEMCQGCFGISNFVWPCENVKQRSFCYLMYTSGSTGKPKGVCGTELGLMNRFLWMQELYPLRGEEYLLFKTSISFIDHLQEFLCAILTSCTLVIPPLSELKQNVFSILHFLQAYNICRLIAVPSLMRTILPTLQSQYDVRSLSSLKLLVLSGEVLPVSLWDMLSKLLPMTSILNLYGSTEVSGDCTYFDCKKLPMILERQALASVPIGVPISNCDVMLVAESDTPDQGEMYVGGCCISNGCLSESTGMSLDYVSLHQDSICNCSFNNCGRKIYFRTGDFAQRLPSGDLVFLGRKDRTVKVNGHRIALEEIENTLRSHPDIVDAAVVPRKSPQEVSILEAFIQLKEKEKSTKIFRSYLRSWLISKLPFALVPHCFFYVESLPTFSSGKVDYTSLAGSAFLTMDVHEVIDSQAHDILQVIKNAFSKALMVEEISNDDDFFMMGGNSISAAHVSYCLGIDMRLLYNFPCPSKLRTALVEKRGSQVIDVDTDAKWKLDLEAARRTMLYSANSAAPALHSLKLQGQLLRTSEEKNDDNVFGSKRLKVDSECASLRDWHPWGSLSPPMSCSLSRCNKVFYERGSGLNFKHQIMRSVEVPRNKKFWMQESWKVYMESCVDASPLVVCKDVDIYLFIGSHSHKFVCINANSGSVQWEIKLDGRVECSAAIVGDFSEVVVGCYGGNIYFLDFSNGSINWTFQTCGEVKSQPIVDKNRQLIWCGSYDHNLYALDYRNRQCVYKLPCGGSVYGSPAIDELCDTLYVASTSGRLTALSIKDSPFHTLWVRELEVPVFGSLSVSSSNGNVICCLVDGHVVSLDSSGSIIWRCKTSGPIFAGPCTSFALSSQVLICCRNGSVYSFELETGDLLWEFKTRDPITASAYIDENLLLVSDPSVLSWRLACVCTSSGCIHLLCVLDKIGKKGTTSKEVVQEFAQLQLQGAVFSSPVMIGGRIMVGCRDDFVHCIAVNMQRSVE